jgi:hypothetical protein
MPTVDTPSINIIEDEPVIDLNIESDLARAAKAIRGNSLGRRRARSSGYSDADIQEFKVVRPGVAAASRSDELEVEEDPEFSPPHAAATPMVTERTASKRVSRGRLGDKDENNDRAFVPYLQRPLVLFGIATAILACAMAAITLTGDGRLTVFDDSELETDPDPVSPTLLEGDSEENADVVDDLDDDADGDDEVTLTTGLVAGPIATGTTQDPETTATTTDSSSTTEDTTSTTIDESTTTTEDPDVSTSSSSSSSTSTTIADVFVPVVFNATAAAEGPRGQRVTSVSALAKSDAVQVTFSFENCDEGQEALIYIFGRDPVLTFTQIARSDCTVPITATASGLASESRYDIRVRVANTWVYRGYLSTT